VASPEKAADIAGLGRVEDGVGFLLGYPLHAAGEGAARVRKGGCLWKKLGVADVNDLESLQENSSTGVDPDL
jgi:hypothetical protein